MPTPWSLLEQSGPHSNLLEFCSSESSWLPLLQRSGAVLFRGFSPLDPTGFEQVARKLCGPPLPYIYRSTPRTQLGEGVFTATEYPANQTIPQHCENAYQRDWPLRLCFGCISPPETGGETPLSDVRRTTDRIRPEVRERFRKAGVLYVRNYGSGVDLPWSTVFQTTDPNEVNAFCQKNGIECEWLPGDRLRTRQVCQGLAVPPASKDEVWFNQAHLFHVSALDVATQRALTGLFRREELPRMAYYGDGDELEPHVLEEIREAFRSEEQTFSWRAGDVLVVDNMRVAHGRRPYTGNRRVLVSMGTSYRQTMAQLAKADSSPTNSTAPIVK